MGHVPSFGQPQGNLLGHLRCILQPDSPTGPLGATLAAATLAPLQALGSDLVSKGKETIGPCLAPPRATWAAPRGSKLGLSSPCPTSQVAPGWGKARLSSINMGAVLQSMRLKLCKLRKRPVGPWADSPAESDAGRGCRQQSRGVAPALTWLTVSRLHR